MDDEMLETLPDSMSPGLLFQLSPLSRIVAEL